MVIKAVKAVDILGVEDDGKSSDAYLLIKFNKTSKETN